MNELPPPPAANSARDATEILRIWLADGRQHVTIAGPIWKDPAAWGLLLVDLAKHVANVYAQTDGQDPERALARIKLGFDAEWTHETDRPAGYIP